MRNFFGKAFLEGVRLWMNSGMTDAASRLTPPPPLLLGAAQGNGNQPAGATFEER